MLGTGRPMDAVQRSTLHYLGTWRGLTFCDCALSALKRIALDCHIPRQLVNFFTQFRSTPHRVLTPLNSDPQPELATPEAHFNQFARVDEGLWAWHFVLRDAQGQGIATVDRAFRGLGREVKWR